MEKFIQLHILTAYPASNLNRDDLGRPKTVTMGNTLRLRVSSQSLKRAWRTSDVFERSLAGHIGIRSKEMGAYAFRALTQGASLADVMADAEATGDLPVLKEKKAQTIGRAIGGVFGKIKKEEKPEKDAPEDKVRSLFLESMETEQIAHFSPEEIEGIAALVEKCRESGEEPEKQDLELLRHGVQAADIAMFGRMLAAAPQFNTDAAVQVAHAMTVHKVAVEDDFFTAVDDLNIQDSGAGHMGVSEFGAGLFYLYVCIDTELLRENLCNNEELTKKTLTALTEAALTVSPTGKQAGFASRAWASFCMAEKGAWQPRSLAPAFLKGIDSPGTDVGKEAARKLLSAKECFDKIYNMPCDAVHFNVLAEKDDEKGSLKNVLDFITE